jgi:hypothetical protein
MSRYIDHAREEFRAAGWVDENGKFKDEWQEAICEHIVKLLEVFSDEGHSGSSAPYAVDLFSKLALFKPIAPLTGEDWEWVDVAERDGGRVYQNKRASHVFKDDNGAYDINGIIFYEWLTREDGTQFKSYFTSEGSRVPVTFPYTPKSEYREAKA